MVEDKLAEIRAKVNLNNPGDRFVTLDGRGKPKLFNEFFRDLFIQTGVTYGLRDEPCVAYEIQPGFLVVEVNDPNYVSLQEHQLAVFNRSTQYINDILDSEKKAREVLMKRVAESERCYNQGQIFQIEAKELFDGMTHYASFVMDNFVPLDQMVNKLSGIITKVPTEKVEETVNWLMRFVRIPTSVFNVEGIILDQQKRIAQRTIEEREVSYEGFFNLWGFMHMDHYLHFSYEDPEELKGSVEGMIAYTDGHALKEQRIVDEMVKIEAMNEHAKAIGFILDNYDGNKEKMAALLRFTEESYEFNERNKYLYTRTFLLYKRMIQALNMDLMNTGIGELSDRLKE